MHHLHEELRSEYTISGNTTTIMYKISGSLNNIWYKQIQKKNQFQNFVMEVSNLIIGIKWKNARYVVCKVLIIC